MPTRFVLIALRPEVTAAAYEQFVREYDYPVLPELRTVIHYRTHRILPDGRDRSHLPFDYIEHIVVTDREAYRRDLDASPGFQRFRQRNPAFVGRTFDFWAEVVTPTPLVDGPAPPGVVIRWEDVAEDAARPGVLLRQRQGQAMRVLLVRLYPGVVVTPQRHPEEQLVHMLRGRLRLHVGDDAYVLAPGESALIPPNVPHSGEAIGTEPAVYLEVLASKPDEAGGVRR